MWSIAPLVLVVACSACAVQPPPRAVVVPAAPVAAAPVTQPQCREFSTSVVVGGRPQQMFGTACLQPDGTWKIDQSLPSQPVQAYVVPPQVYRPYYPPAYLADPWYYGPPLFIGGVFVGGGWGVHGHAGWHGAWPAHPHRRW